MLVRNLLLVVEEEDNVSEVNYVHEAVNTYPSQTKAVLQDESAWLWACRLVHLKLNLHFITVCCKW